MERDEEGLNVKQKSRYSVQVAYEYIHKLPDNELVYIVEDDYLHYEDSISKMVEAWCQRTFNSGVERLPPICHGT